MKLFTDDDQLRVESSISLTTISALENMGC